MTQDDDENSQLTWNFHAYKLGPSILSCPELQYISEDQGAATE